MSSVKFQISEQLFHYTLRRLDQFRHFLFVENITTTLNVMIGRYGLRWYHHHDGSPVNENDRKRTLTSTGNNKTNTTIIHYNKNDNSIIPNEVYTWDPMMSALDDALYEFALRKYNNDTEHLWDPFENQFLVDEYFSKGVDRGCTDGCCGLCSQY